MTITEPMKLAAAAPRNGDDDQPPEQTGQDLDLHELCEQWVRWCHTRKLYGTMRRPPSLLGRLTVKSRAVAGTGGPDAIASAELAAFHLAYLAQPDAIDKQIFELHYWQRVKPIKAAAVQLGITRKRWYGLLSDFRMRVHAQSLEIAAGNQRQRSDMDLARAERGR